MRNKYDYRGQCKAQGDGAESQFFKIATEKGLKIREATKSEQFKHIDYWVHLDDIEYPIDVKSKKKIKRADGEAQDELCWIEIRGVRKNGSSWLVNGESTFIAFERENEFLIVDRIELLDLVAKICDFKTFVKDSSAALYKSYRRKERPEEHLTIIKFSDMLKIKHKIWQKSS